MSTGSSNDNPTPSSAKKVDESWKDAVRKESSETSLDDQSTSPEQASFLQFVSTLAMQVLVFLGELVLQDGAAPRTDLPQARYLIDVIKLLEDKTKGNLSAEEAEALKNIVYELQLKYVEKSESRIL